MATMLEEKFSIMYGYMAILFNGLKKTKDYEFKSNRGRSKTD